MSLYLDASVLVPILTYEAATPAIEAFLRQADQVLIVSDLAAAEVSSAISRKVRKGESTADAGAGLLLRFDDWRNGSAGSVALQKGDVARATALVRRFDLMLRTPDALHLIMARRHDARLVTFDRLLGRAANILHIPVVTPA